MPGFLVNRRPTNFTNVIKNVARTAAAEASRQVQNFYNREIAEVYTNPNYGRGNRPPVKTEDTVMTPVGRKRKQMMPGHGNKRVKFTGISRKKKRMIKKKRDKSRKKLMKSDFSSTGIRVQYEAGGRIADPQCVYVGHSTYQSTTWFQALCMQILKTLFAKHGVTVRALEHRVANDAAVGTTGNYNVTYTYTADPENTAVVREVSYNIDAANTWWANAEGLLVSINNSVGSTEHVSFERFELNKVIGTTTITLASIDCKEINVAVKSRSILKVQNASTANVTGAETGDDNDNTEDIERNPLKGNLYKSSKWKNYIDVTHADTVAENNDFEFIQVADRINGSIRFASTVNSLLLRKPPTKYTLGLQQQTRLLLQPGEIKHSFINFETVLKFNTLINKMGQIVRDGGAGTGANRKTDLGNIALFGLEKLLDSRVDEGNIACGFEIFNSLHMTFKGMKRRTAEMKIVQTTAV